MRTPALLSMVCLLLAALPAHAELKGVALYERGDYVRARRALEADLRSKGLTHEERIKARLYLAAALYASGAEEAARIQLEELALTAPDLQVDPILFPPDFVAMAAEARKKLESERLEAERQRLEAEAKARQQDTPPAEEPPPLDEGKEEPGTVRLRPEVFGFADPLGKAWGLGGGMTLGLGSVDLNARVMGGAELGLGAEVGLLLGDGSVRPRLALRGTAIPSISGLGGGAVAGLRVAASSRLTFLVDVGAEVLKVDEGYRSFVLSSSAGVGFDLF